MAQYFLLLPIANIAGLFYKKGKIMELSAILTPSAEGGYVAYNPETGTTTQGESIEEALSNLREATELYLEEFPLILSGRSLLTTFQVAKHA
ncbi:MAG: type II toxin-antitoxin system HicB family antitoxin [Chlorobium sp.]